MQEMKEFNVIADALKQISSGQMTMKRRQSILADKIINGIRAITYSNQKYPTQRELHIMLSCDQRFCRRFLKPLNNYLETIIQTLVTKKGEYEYKTFTDNSIQKVEDGGFLQVAGALDDAEPYKYAVSTKYDVYRPNNDKVNIVIFGIQSHELDTDDYDGLVSIKKRKMIRDFKQVKEFASSIKELYDHIYIYGYCMEEDEYVCYKSGFKNSMQPLAHLSQEIYLYTSMSAYMENTVRMQVMSEAAENSEKEAKKAKAAFNKGRQEIITASTSLITFDD